MSTLNLIPEIQGVKEREIRIILSKDFQKIYDIELERIDHIKNYYFEDPHHCRTFEIKDVDQFNEDLNEMQEQFKFEMLTPWILEQIKYRVAELCNYFVYTDRYIINSSNLYKKWDKEKYSTK